MNRVGANLVFADGCPSRVFVCSGAKRVIRSLHESPLPRDPAGAPLGDDPYDRPYAMRMTVAEWPTDGEAII